MFGKNRKREPKKEDFGRIKQIHIWLLPNPGFILLQRLFKREIKVQSGPAIWKETKRVFGLNLQQVLPLSLRVTGGHCQLHLGPIHQGDGLETFPKRTESMGLEPRRKQVQLIQETVGKDQGHLLLRRWELSLP